MLADGVNETLVYYPDDTCACGGVISISDSPYRRHQVFDIPSQAFSVVEHQLHQGQCCQCSKTAKATLPDNVNQGQMGNNLLAYVAMQSARFELEAHAGGSIRNHINDSKVSKVKYGPGQWIDFTEGNGNSRVRVSTVNGKVTVSS